MLIKPEEVDVRLVLTSDPVGNQPVKMTCPPHIHKARIGQEDDKGSLAVYSGNVHCFGCGFHLYRRYASIAFLVGLWDGVGDENSPEVAAKVVEVRKHLPEFIGKKKRVGPDTIPPLEPYIDLAFHQYLLRYKEDRLVDELMTKRGLSMETIREYKLGHTGTHFSLPVYDVAGTLVTVRYRADETCTDTNAGDFRKYEGTWRRNRPILYPLQVVRGLHALEDLWIVEGEYDALSAIQAGDVALTVTNGVNSIIKIMESLLFDLPKLHVNRYVLATDQDGAGDSAAASILSVMSDLGMRGTRARWSGAKDLTDFYSVGGSKKGIWFE